MDVRVGNNYKLGRKIGRGAFGDIYIGFDICSGNSVAIKLESIKNGHQQLQLENKIYRHLNNGIGIPCVYYYGSEGGYNVLVMELCGPNLEDLFNYCNRRFSLKTVCMLAQEILLRLEYLHSKDYIHRDVKPENFVIGMNAKANVIHLLDFGLSKRFRNPVTKVHIPYRENKHLSGTPRYASLGNHLGIEQSRRDDLESLGFMLLYFLRGSLPWQGLRIQGKKEKYAKILEYKIQTSFDDLCSGLPNEFQTFFEYCRSLRFDDCPDYAYLRSLFSSLLQREHLKDDGVYDWIIELQSCSPQSLPHYCLSVNGQLREDLRSPAHEVMRKCTTIEELAHHHPLMILTDCSTKPMCAVHSCDNPIVSDNSHSFDLHSVQTCGEMKSIPPSISNEEERSYLCSTNQSAASQGLNRSEYMERKGMFQGLFTQHFFVCLVICFYHFCFVASRDLDW